MTHAGLLHPPNTPHICNFAGRAAQNDDAIVYYPEGLYTAQRRFASFSRSNAPDPDEVMRFLLMSVIFYGSQ